MRITCRVSGMLLTYAATFVFIVLYDWMIGTWLGVPSASNDAGSAPEENSRWVSPGPIVDSAVVQFPRPASHPIRSATRAGGAPPPPPVGGDVRTVCAGPAEPGGSR